MARTVKVYRQQNIWDVSVQESGTVENVIDILIANNIGFSASMPDSLAIPELTLVNKQVQNMYKRKDIIPATDKEIEDAGIGISPLGIDFYVG